MKSALEMVVAARRWHYFAGAMCYPSLDLVTVDSKEIPDLPAGASEEVLGPWLEMIQESVKGTFALDAFRAMGMDPARLAEVYTPLSGVVPSDVKSYVQLGSFRMDDHEAWRRLAVILRKEIAAIYCSGGHSTEGYVCLKCFPDGRLESLTEFVPEAPSVMSRWPQDTKYVSTAAA